MAANKHIDKICCIAAALSLLLAVLFMQGEALGLAIASRQMGYESRLFDTSRVHTVDILMEDWDGFIATCENEEYALCSAVIDGETYGSIGIRAKGNTSLSSVSAMNSDRYSFKMEFDHYDSTKTYHGLDKLSLNNLIQDNSFLKDHLVYEMMRLAGAAAPHTSFVYITVNGTEWGLYLAVEGIEDAFLQRNYGSDHGELYKPDSLDFGGGRGNGRNFSMDEFAGENGADADAAFPGMPLDGILLDPGGAGGENGNAAMPGAGGAFGGGNMPQRPEESGSERFPGTAPGEEGAGFTGGGMRGNAAADVLLRYIDDDPESYANIFDNAKTDVTAADRERLIKALQVLSSSDPADALDADALLRYFAVHNFVVNGDSYTGSMVHNYYLYEKDGRLSMLPWDYNLAFGTFHGNNAVSAVNDPIDTPLSCTEEASRPMIGWIFADEAYTELYHAYLGQFVADVFESGVFEKLVDDAVSLIAPYVEKDPTKFCTYAEFEAGAAAIKQFCLLRAESVKAQLAGSVPSTAQGQAAEGAVLVDTGELDLADMGTMNSAGGGKENFDMERGDRLSAPGASQSAAAWQHAVPGGAFPFGSGNAPASQGGMPGGAGPEDYSGFVPQGTDDAAGISGAAAESRQPGTGEHTKEDTAAFEGGASQRNTRQSGADLIASPAIPAALLVFGILFAAGFKRRG